MTKITQELLEYANAATSDFENKYYLEVLDADKYIAIRSGLSEQNLTMIEVKNKVVFENQFEKQATIRIKNEEYHENHSIRKRHEQLIKFLEEKHPNTLKEFEEDKEIEHCSLDGIEINRLF